MCERKFNLFLILPVRLVSGRNVLIRKISWSIKFEKDYKWVKVDVRNIKSLIYLYILQLSMGGTWLGHVWKTMSNILNEMASENSSTILQIIQFLTVHVDKSSSNVYRATCIYSSPRPIFLDFAAVVRFFYNVALEIASEGCKKCKTIGNH